MLRKIFQISGALILLVLTGATLVIVERVTTAQEATSVPNFEIDPLFFQNLPNRWTTGQVSGISVDNQDHIWILHRPATVAEGERSAALNPPAALCCVPAPPILEFDQNGRLVKAWGGPGQEYEWPATEHGITVDYKNNVWVAGNGKGDHIALKFSTDGKFLMQLGRKNQSTGSNDTANLNGPAGIFVYPKTNEVFVADGYTNRRVIVFDADTGAYKRHWGAYGIKPDDKASKARQATGAGPQQFNTPHGIEVSKDGIVYVTDRANNRVQSFTLEGKFLKEGFIKRESQGTGTAFGVALSTDPDQRFVYIADGSNERIAILDRKSLEEVGHIGRPGRKAGEFFHLHSLDVDPQGNIVTGESQGYRVQKFIYKGLSTTAR